MNEENIAKHESQYIVMESHLGMCIMMRAESCPACQCPPLILNCIIDVCVLCAGEEHGGEVGDGHAS